MIGMDLEDEEVDSIGGWLLKKLEGMPSVGQRIQQGQILFEVAEAERFRILRINVIRKSE
ncbi:Transporter associated domain protein [compost metagenome]